MSREFSVMHLGKGKNRIELFLERKVRKNGFAGFVCSDLFEESIGIIVKDDLLEELEMRGGYISSNEDGTSPIIYLDTETFNNIKRDKGGARFLLMHEIGHYCCGHLKQLPSLDEENARRSSLIEEYQVSPDELEADKFAATYLGALDAYWALQELMESRFKFGILCGLDQTDELACREYQLRIDAICEEFSLFDEDEDDEDCDEE